MGVVVWAGFVRTAFGNGLGPFHHQGAADAVFSGIIAGPAGRAGVYRVFAFGVVGAAVENSEAAASFHYLSFFADRAYYS